VLQAEAGNVVAAARILGLSRSALYQKLRKHNLTPTRGAAGPDA
jgi:transcriptional regulator of acetoin/glycerol metabolism